MSEKSEKRWKRQGSWSDVNYPVKQRPPSRDSKDKIEPDFTPDPEKMAEVLRQREMRENSKDYAMKRIRGDFNTGLARWKAEQLVDNQHKKKERTVRSAKPVSHAGTTLVTASQSHFEAINSLEFRLAEENRKKAAALKAKLDALMAKKKE